MVKGNFIKLNGTWLRMSTIVEVTANTEDSCYVYVARGPYVSSFGLKHNADELITLLNPALSGNHVNELIHD